MSSAPGFRYFILIIKLSVFFACVYLGWSYLQTHQPEWRTLSLNSPALILPGIIILAILNWSLETYKWTLLIIPIEKLRFWSAFKATLSGVAVSFVTPFRIGDFAGRIAHLKASRKRATLHTLYGNYSQLCITMIFGAVGLTYLFDSNLVGEVSLFPMFIVFSWAIACFMVLFFFRPELPFKLFPIQSLDLLKSAVKNLKATAQLSILLLSASRYIIFVSQFAFAYLLFGAESSFLHLALLTTAVYLLITFAPSPILGKLGVRESVALFIIGSVESSEVILAGSLLIWLVNLFIPALIGSYWLFTIKSVSDE